jgi:hypothetical protein
MLVAATTTAALMGVGLSPAGGKEKLGSFGGSCALEGTVDFSPPATNAQQSLDVRYHATGTCNGMLNGRAVSGAPVTVRQAVDDVDGSCMHASTTKPGRGELSFADGTTIGYTFEFDFVATDGTFRWRGERSGSALGHGSFVTQRTPPDVAEQCAGKGAARVPLDVKLVTDEPLVDKQRGGGAGKRGSDRRRASSGLRVSVRPRSVATGRRTVFAFRVATTSGRPAPRAVVRFAGRRARVGRRGKAKIAVTLRRPGRRVARVSKPGFRRARATIRVRRG